MRALNAVKMERMFAKPFVAALEGHIEGVECIVRRPKRLGVIASASWDGEIILHDLPLRQQLVRFPNAHKGKVSALCFADEDRLLSCGVDRNVKLWDVRSALESGEGSSTKDPITDRKPLAVFPGKAAFSGIDHHAQEPLFATASNVVQIWDETKSTPVSDLTFSTSTETVTGIRFNQSEPSVLASIGSDRTFTLYDIRTGKAERRLVMQMRSNDLAWSPTFPTSILLASEDHNLYTFDIRSLQSPTQIYKAHVSAVISCDWSPTGLEFVSGGWDRTVRIWKEGVGKQPEVYHTKRMQRVLSTAFTADARYVLSGSDDGNVRIWKAKANEKLGIIDTREKAAMEYRDALKERWKSDKAIGRISRSRHLPKAVHNADTLKRTMVDARKVKEDRRRKHTRAGENKPKAERKKVVVAEQT
ncbi:WD40 repeat-like protein [Sistotremastrum niveocremeum HHB9708]|uniref:DDB1- and CUL4-associated factor 13 n=1 Tax=Sistotremastrum niveocremeum HHB9708 TaxID=1314777 RepID=A0A164PD14_9AGAM|nr:WD40 repeat-like protein [Sistotremastrum niveocremeum HHB9708]